MASAVALVTISFGLKSYKPGETIHDLSKVDLEDLKGFVRELNPGEAVKLPEGLVLAVEGALPEIVDPVDEVPGVDSGKLVDGDPLIRDALAEAEGEDAEEGPKDRVGDVKAAIDLLTDADFTAAGRPKVAPLTAILGYKPDADDVTTALAQREAEGK